MFVGPAPPVSVEESQEDAMEKMVGQADDMNLFYDIDVPAVYVPYSPRVIVMYHWGEWKNISCSFYTCTTFINYCMTNIGEWSAKLIGSAY